MGARLNSRLLHGRHEARLVVDGRGWRFEVVLAQPLIKLTACEPQSLGRLRLVATDLVQYARDSASLYGVEINFGLVELESATWRRKRQLRRRNGAAFRDDRRPLEGVAQFAHVARPGVT